MLTEKIELEQRETLRAALWWMSGILAIFLFIFSILGPAITIAKILHLSAIVIFAAAGYFSINPKYYTICAWIIMVVPIVATFAATITDGGINSFMMPLLILTPMAAGLFFSKNAAFICTAVVITGYAAIVGLDYAGLVMHPEPTSSDKWYSLGLLVYATALAAVAITVTTSRRNRLLAELLEAYRDISEAQTDAIQQRDNAELLRQRAERASEVKTDFLANISHELRTPLNGVIGMTQILETTDLNDRQSHIVASIRSSSDTLLHTVNALLNITEIEAGRIDINPVEFKPEDVLKRSTLSVMTLAQKKGVGVITSVGPDVPEVLNSDPKLIGSILSNLVGNAAKFTHSGSIVVSVTLDAKERMVFEVSDTGIGIASDQLKSIFDRFHQVPTHEHIDHKGTGLGLTICQDLVEILGGEIGVESVPGKGSRFWFVIPQAAPDQSSSTVSEFQHRFSA